MMNKNLYKAAVDDIKVNEKLIKEIGVKMERKPKMWKNARKYGIMAASLAVIIMAGVIINNKTGFISNKSVIEASKTDSIYINSIQRLTSAKLFIPEGATSKDYSLEQLTEVFGRNPIPAMPKDFNSLCSSTNITFDAEGKMLFMSALSYSKDANDPEASSIDIKLNKSALPPKDCVYSSEPKESIIGSTKVNIGSMTMEDKSEIYSAEFIYNEIGYNITVKKVDKDTFINLLKSIVNK